MSREINAPDNPQAREQRAFFLDKHFEQPEVYRLFTAIDILNLQSNPDYKAPAFSLICLLLNHS